MQNVLDEYGKEQQCLLEKKIRRQRFTNGTLNEYKCALFCCCMSSFIEIRLLRVLSLQMFDMNLLSSRERNDNIHEEINIKR